MFLNLIPGCLVQISQWCEKQRERRRKVEVLTRLTFVTILPQASFLAGMSEATRVGVKDVSKLLFFLRTGTHVISRSPGSRDERALRAPLKATPDSKQRSSPRYSCSWTTAAPPSRFLSFFSRAFYRLYQLATPYLFLFSFRISCISLRILSQLCLTAYLTLSSHFIFLLSFSRLMLFLLIRSPPRDTIVFDVYSISGNFKLSLNDRELADHQFFSYENEFS